MSKGHNHTVLELVERLVEGLRVGASAGIDEITRECVVEKSPIQKPPIGF